MLAQEVAQSVPSMFDAPSLHEYAIGQIMLSDARINRVGFWADARSLWNELTGESGDQEPFPKMDWIPDAYMIDRDRCRLVIYEIEDRWPLTRQKRAAFGAFWGVWDEMDFEGGWRPVFLVVNRFGSVTHGLQGCDLLVEGIMQDAYDRANPPKQNRYRRKFG